MEKIVVVIESDGSTSIEGEGFSGPACDKVLRELAESLGEVVEVRKKADYFKQAKIAQKERA